MSELPSRADWWRAADGKWYPPSGQAEVSELWTEPRTTMLGPTGLTQPGSRAVAKGKPATFVLVLVAAGVLVLCCGGGLLGWIVHLSSIPTYQQLADDFSAPTGAFASSRTPDHDFSRQGGQFVMRAVDDHSGALLSFGPLRDEIADYLYSSADVTSTAPIGDAAPSVGVGCFDRGERNGFLALADPNGGGGHVYQFTNGAQREDPVLSFVVPEDQRRPLRRVELRCTPEPGGTLLEVYADDSQPGTPAHDSAPARAEQRVDGGPPSYQQMALALGPGRAGDEVRFDNASAVTRSSDGIPL